MGPNGKIGLPPLRLSAPPGNSARSAALAQLVEHRIRNAGVTGSSPVSGTIPLYLIAPQSVDKGTVF